MQYICNRVAEVLQRLEGPSPKSLDSEKITNTITITRKNDAFVAKIVNTPLKKIFIVILLSSEGCQLLSFEKRQSEIRSQKQKKLPNTSASLYGSH